MIGKHITFCSEFAVPDLRTAKAFAWLLSLE